MKKNKPEIWWCVVNKVGTCIPHTIRCLQRESERVWEEILGENWKDLQKQGYKTVKIEVRKV